MMTTEREQRACVLFVYARGSDHTRGRDHTHGPDINRFSVAYVADSKLARERIFLFGEWGSLSL